MKSGVWSGPSFEAQLVDKFFDLQALKPLHYVIYETDVLLCAKKLNFAIVEQFSTVFFNPFLLSLFIYQRNNKISAIFACLRITDSLVWRQWHVKNRLIETQISMIERNFLHQILACWLWRIPIVSFFSYFWVNHGVCETRLCPLLKIQNVLIVVNFLNTICAFMLAYNFILHAQSIFIETLNL